MAGKEGRKESWMSTEGMQQLRKERQKQGTTERSKEEKKNEGSQ